MTTAIQKLPTYIQEKVDSAQVPVKYDVAIKALAACRHIDDAKYFADKSDALAAWAKIYKHDEAAIEAKRLRLHAFRRMGVIASELRPSGVSREVGHGHVPGTRSLLMEHGLNKNQADSATALAKSPKETFTVAVESPTPPSPSGFKLSQLSGSDGWKALNGYRIEGASGGVSLGSVRCFCRRLDAKAIARDLTPSEAKKAKVIATEIIEWMDTFDQYLPKGE